MSVCRIHHISRLLRNTGSEWKNTHVYFSIICFYTNEVIPLNLNCFFFDQFSFWPKKYSFRVYCRGERRDDLFHSGFGYVPAAEGKIVRLLAQEGEWSFVDHEAGVVRVEKQTEAVGFPSFLSSFTFNFVTARLFCYMKEFLYRVCSTNQKHNKFNV